MGLIAALTGIGGALRGAEGLAEVFVGNKTKENAAQHAEYLAALAQLAQEFEHPRESWFDATISGLNRLPRPALAIGTLGLFVYAMADPIGFADRMQGLDLVPDQLWWLLGAIVSFYFGAREMHYLRSRKPKVALKDLVRVTEARAAIDDLRPLPARDLAPVGTHGQSAESVVAPVVAPVVTSVAASNVSVSNPAIDPDYNAAVADWRAAHR